MTQIAGVAQSTVSPNHYQLSGDEISILYSPTAGPVMPGGEKSLVIRTNREHKPFVAIEFVA